MLRTRGATGSKDNPGLAPQLSPSPSADRARGSMADASSPLGSPAMSRSPSDMMRNVASKKSRASNGQRRLPGMGRQKWGTRSTSSRSRSSRSRDSDGASGVSSDSEDLEDLDAIPDNLKIAIPLHMQNDAQIQTKKEAQLKAPKEIVELGDTQADSQLSGTRASFFGSSEIPRKVWKHPLAPDATSYCNFTWVCIQICATTLWILGAFTLLSLHIWRLQEVALESHRYAADTLLRTLEVNASGHLSPALTIARSVALAGRSGLFELEAPYASLAAILKPEMDLEPKIRRVQVLGLSAIRMFRVLPGTLHDDTVRLDLQEPLIYAKTTSSCRTGSDLWACFNLDTTDMTLYSSTTDALALNLRGPTIYRYDDQGLALDSEDYIVTHHLLATFNITGNANTGVSTALFVDVSIDLASLWDAARAAAPETAHLFISTTDGTLLAASSSELDGGPIWRKTLEEGADEETAVYTADVPTIWDLPEEWVQYISAADLVSESRLELQVGSDMIVVRPVALGATNGRGSLSAASPETLRIGVFVPLSEVTRPSLEQLQYAGLGVLACPFVAAAVVIILHIVFRILKCFWRILIS